jgi:hypothetical protein
MTLADVTTSLQPKNTGQTENNAAILPYAYIHDIHTYTAVVEYKTTTWEATFTSLLPTRLRTIISIMHLLLLSTFLLTFLATSSGYSMGLLVPDSETPPLPKLSIPEPHGMDTVGDLKPPVGITSLRDDLLRKQFRTPKELSRMGITPGKRNTVIVMLNKKTGKAISELQGMNDSQLIKLACQNWSYRSRWWKC